MSTVKADGALVGGRIRTLDSKKPFAQAVAWRDGVIIAVGSDDEIRAVCDQKTKIVDLKGSALVPGLIDSHFHPIGGVDHTRGGIDLMDCRTLDDLCARLKAERARLPAGSWVLGYGLAYSVFPGGVPDNRWFSEAVEHGPAMLTLYDHHAAVVTQKALDLAGVTGPVEFAEHSDIIFVNGVPTGELRERAAMDHVAAAIPPLTEEQCYANYLDAFKKWNEMGLTGMHAMDGTPETLETLRKLEANGDLTLRLVIPMSIRPGITKQEMQELAATYGQHGRTWVCKAAKFFIDGTVEAGTAWLFEPDTKGTGTLPFWPDPAAYAEAVKFFSDAGFQCITHAIGDKAVKTALDAYKAAGHPPGVRHRVEHAETLRDEELARFAAEDVVVAMQPLHADMSFDSDEPLWPALLGPERAARGWRYGDLKRASVTVPLGSDWPVAPADPRLSLASAQLRRAPWREDMPAYNPEQALTGLQALEGYTIEGARTVGEADKNGCIAVGFRADLTGFADDPVTHNPETLPQLPVTITVVDGRVVHQSLS